ncbi:MAG: sigma-70 family RNA polymerase sigma factor [Promethearchaeota archaeon]|jgi:RNA polymerase sigma factor (sigma-70 family)
MTKYLADKWDELFQRDPNSAWQTFLKKYSNLIKSVCAKMSTDHDIGMELYTYTLEKFQESDYKKLVAYYNKSRPYKFSTWILVITRNCCIDWFRDRGGRKRFIKCIEELSPLDQIIFRYIYWDRYSYEATFEIIKTNHNPDITLDEIEQRLSSINHILGKNTGWSFKNTWQSIRPLILLDSLDQIAVDQLNTDLLGQENISDEQQLIINDSADTITKFCKDLPIQDQLLIRLYFYNGLSLKQISRILKIKNKYRVHRKLQKIIKHLRKIIDESGITPGDLY